ncbi:hypothetical protein BCEN4_740130 [Burkholderia cenocepacia]|nr:hypothetical protein BCEN4_740130 [Burkholderia cenocepacia]
MEDTVSNIVELLHVGWVFCSKAS